MIMLSKKMKEVPISSLAKKTPITTVANSGAELPAAIKVAPATSGDIFNSATNSQIPNLNMHEEENHPKSWP